MKLVPVLCGAAFKNKGVQPLLDAVVDFLPSPLDVPPVEGQHPHTGAPEVRKADDNEPFAALAFKLMTDKHVGHLTYIRVYSGHVEDGRPGAESRARGKKERIGRLLQMHANKRQEIDEVFAGDIAAVVGLKTIATGDTLCNVQHPILLESLEFPEPVISIAIEPKTKADMERLSGALGRLAQEDPPSGFTSIRRRARRSSPAWASSTSRSSPTACCASSACRRTSAARRSPTRRRSRTQAKAEGRYIKQTAARATTAVVLSVGPGRRARASSSRTRSAAARFLGVHPAGAPGLRGSHRRAARSPACPSST